MNKEINILSMFRNKNKQSFFSIHQIYNKIKAYDNEITVNFHILWDDNKELNGYNQKYSQLIDEMFGKNITSYNREFFNSYCKKCYNISDEQIKSFNNFYLIYRILFGHYLRRVKMIDYFIILDDDILINYDLNDVINYSVNNTPFLVEEIVNTNCDKVLFNQIASIYEEREFVEKYSNRNPNFKGFNAGFQGVDASIFDDFLSTSFFNVLLSLFDYSSTKNPDGSEFFGDKRFKLDTQEQSFFSCMNICKSKNTPILLDSKTTFIVPNWGTYPTIGKLDPEDENQGYTYALKSNITHFIGHTQGKGKPQSFLNAVDKYLTKENLNL